MEGTRDDGDEEERRRGIDGVWEGLQGWLAGWLAGRSARNSLEEGLIARKISDTSV